MRRTIYYLLTLIVCVSLLDGCKQSTTPPLPVDTQTVEDSTTHIAEEITPTQVMEETVANQATEEPAATQVTKESTAIQAAEGATVPQAMEETEATQATEEATVMQTTEEVHDYEFCSVCHIWYEGINLVDGQCEDCRKGLCFLCGGPDGLDHNCNDYPNVICPNPDCDWGIYTTGVGIDGIICPKCGTRCV